MGIGVVGLGKFGQFSLNSYIDIPGCQVLGVYDLDQDRSEKVAEKFSTRSFPSLEKLLSVKQIQIIILNTPHYLHYSQARASLKAGKNAFVEKPLTLKVEEAEELFRIAKRSNLTLGCNHPLIFSEIYQRLKKLLKGPQLGRVEEIIVENRGTEGSIKEEWYWDKNKSGGWFLGAAYHFIDLFNFLLGEGKLLESKENMKSGKTFETSATFLYEKTKAIINHYLNTPAQGVDCQFYLKATEAEVQVLGWVPQSLTVTFKSGQKDILKVRRSRNEEYLNLIKKSFCDFLNDVSGKQTELRKKQILATLKLAIQAQQKAKTGS